MGSQKRLNGDLLSEKASRGDLVCSLLPLHGLMSDNNVSSGRGRGKQSKRKTGENNNKRIQFGIIYSVDLPRVKSNRAARIHFGRATTSGRRLSSAARGCFPDPDLNGRITAPRTLFYLARAEIAPERHKHSKLESRRERRSSSRL